MKKTFLVACLVGAAVGLVADRALAQRGGIVSLPAKPEDSGLEIDCAIDGKEALMMVEATPDKYDIVFMDMQMPVMDGLEASRRIRALPESRRGRLPIIAMTANVFKSDIDECLAAGMDDHLGKPLDIEKIMEKLRKYAG